MSEMRTPTPNPTRTTKRLVIFRQDVVISETLCASRAVFTAFLKDADTPRIICTMLVTLDGMVLPYLDWVATDPDFRRQGYASELWGAVEEMLGREMYADGVSEAGEALVAKMYGDSKGTA